ncbi:hypothetical protein [Plantactinospora sp. WMMB782]|uniref:hypothetical protein n=1 Tax=Plantactinospora sp. WMMB782 TaxID=3404121 RepID=UPI003B951CFF
MKGELKDPNVLPPGHTREDYDFDYADGTRGPIRLQGWTGPWGEVKPPAVWCVEHGWEDEITEEAT